VSAGPRRARAPAPGPPAERSRPWQVARAAVLVARLGASAEGRLAAELAQSSLSTTTQDSYGPKWLQFVHFCADAGLCALPAAPDTCVLYLAHLAHRGTLQPGSVQPYLSAINTVHRQLLFLEEGPATGPLLDQVRTGWARQWAASHPERRRDTRAPLPAWVALAALRAVTADAAAALQPKLPLPLLRALFFVAFGFQCMARASSYAAMVAGDVEESGGLLRVRFTKEKGKDTDQQVRVLPLPAACIPELLAALAHWVWSRDAAWAAARPGALPPARGFFALPGDAASLSASARCGGWLSVACGSLRAAPPPGQVWQSHSLRGGAASAAKAAGFDAGRINWWGGWAHGSRTAEREYVDYSVMPDEGSRVFFGWALAALPPPPPLR